MRTSTTTPRPRRRMAAAVTGLAVLGLSACSAGGGDVAAAPTGGADSGQLTWWGWTPDAVNAEKLIAAFNEEYPDIEVTFVSKPIDSYDSVLGPAITSSDGPDVFNVAPGSANGGVDTFGAGALDLTPAVEAALGEDWQDQLAPAGVDPLSVDGKLIGVSAGAVYSGGLWINQDIFDQYGLTAPTTMDEWKQVCATLESNGLDLLRAGCGQHAFDMDTFEAIMENVEPGLYVDASEGEVPYTDERFVQGMEIWKSLFDEGIMQEGAIGLQQYPDANNQFMSGKAAMVMMGTWYTQYAVRDSMLAAMEAAGVANPEPITITPADFPDLAGTGNTGALFGDADYGLAVSAPDGPGRRRDHLRAVARHQRGRSAGGREHAEQRPGAQGHHAGLGRDRPGRPGPPAGAAAGVHRACGAGHRSPGSPRSAPTSTRPSRTP